VTRSSSPELRVLHAVRVLGFADGPTVSDRAGTGVADAVEMLRDAEADGLVQHTAFADLEGWSLTEHGRAVNERLLARELADADPGGVILAVYRDFLPLNTVLLRACTDWQLRPAGADRLAPNDHTDPAWDAQILDELAALETGLVSLVARLSDVLERFGGYDARFATALRRARDGQVEGVDGTSIDSCHRVWFQLHEDLLATLGLDRGAEP
jgi:hypothetical protein